MKLLTKLIRPHSDGCSALRQVAIGKWDTPWAYVEDHVTYGRANTPSEKGGRHRWRYARCNSAYDCRGYVAFRETEIVELLPHYDKAKK